MHITVTVVGEYDEKMREALLMLSKLSIITTDQPKPKSKAESFAKGVATRERNKKIAEAISENSKPAREYDNYTPSELLDKAIKKRRDIDELDDTGKNNRTSSTSKSTEKQPEVEYNVDSESPRKLDGAPSDYLQVSHDQLRTLAKWLMDNGYGSQANQAIQSVGGTSLSTVPVERRGVLFSILNEMVNARRKETV